MTARICRYCGSAAVMIRALVAGSAWICPPVEGWAEGCVGAVEGLEPAAGVVVTGVATPPPAAAPPVPVVVAASAARRVIASLVASAFFRYTT